MSQPGVALQLFTVRQELQKDYVGCLRQVRDIGYEAVQLTGDIPYDGPKMKEVLGEVGLRVAGIHVGLEELKDKLGYWIDFSSRVGTDDLVCPYLPEQYRGGRDEWLETASLLDRIGERCRRQGKRLSYHNHSFEFVDLDGQYGLDLLYENTGEQNLYAELDTYWIQHGGADPVEYIRRYSGRMVILHLKDMAADEERSFTEIGSGILDWPAIHRAALQAGVQWYAIEQDVCKIPPLESARRILDYVSKMVGGPSA